MSIPLFSSWGWRLYARDNRVVITCYLNKSLNLSICWICDVLNYSGPYSLLLQFFSVFLRFSSWNFSSFGFNARAVFSSLFLKIWLYSVFPHANGRAKIWVWLYEGSFFEKKTASCNSCTERCSYTQFTVRCCRYARYILDVCTYEGGEKKQRFALCIRRSSVKYPWY